MAIAISAKFSRNDHMYRVWMDGIVNKFRGSNYMPKELFNGNILKKQKVISQSYLELFSYTLTANINIKSDKILSFRLYNI